MTGPEPGLRERKKQMTRRALLETAERMFGERGFDNVTVAEIAAANDVASKTVFVYFPAKEDLVFHGEAAIADALVRAIAERRVGDTPLEAVTALLHAMMAADTASPEAALTHLLRLVGDSTVLRARMRLMWEHFEDAVALALAEETGTQPHTASTRVAAAQLVTVFRLMASPHVLAGVDGRPRSRRSGTVRRWLDEAVATVGAGLGDYARRTDG